MSGLLDFSMECETEPLKGDPVLNGSVGARGLLQDACDEVHRRMHYSLLSAARVALLLLAPGGDVLRRDVNRAALGSPISGDRWGGRDQCESEYGLPVFVVQIPPLVRCRRLSSVWFPG